MLIKTQSRLFQVLKKAKADKRSVGLVPTMGALHPGHGALIAASVSQNDLTIVTIFVNRKQFGPNEDFDRYPRSVQNDYDFCRRFGNLVVFAPSESELIPKNGLSSYSNKYYRNILCDRFRPGHFDGVASIVLHLFHMIHPENAYFGLKDYQQYRIIKKITSLEFGETIRVIGISTVRHKNGLAMSSRNKYLSKQEREAAAKIRKQISLILEMFREGKLTRLSAYQQAKRVVDRCPLFSLQYFEILKDVDLTNASQKYARLNSFLGAWAIKSTSTRLIDNVLL